VDWSIRNSVNYAVSGVLTALELTSKFPGMVVENFYKKTVNALHAGASKAPYAFVLPAGQRDQTQVDRAVNLLRRQAIEVHRLTSDTTVGKDTIASGSYLVKLNQPYGRLAKTLLEKQAYPDANLRTYDDSAWTMGLASNITVRTIDDKAILDAAAALLTSDVETRGAVTGTGNTIVVRHNGSLNLVTLRYRLKDVAVRAARVSFKANDSEFPAGSFIIDAGASSDRVRSVITSLGLQATALPTPPQVDTVNVDLPRLAIYTTWANTEKVGWVRLAFDRWEIPFDLIHKDHVRSGASLRAKYDVIVIPHQTQGGKALVYEQPRLSKPLPYRRHERFKSFGMYAETDDVRGGMGIEGVAEFERFVNDGGLLMTFGVASFFPAEFGLTRSVEAQRATGNWYAPGPYVQTEILRPEHPVVFGYADKLLPVRWADGPLLQAGANPEFAAFVGSTPNPPSVVARFQGGEAGVLSGLLRGADQLRNRPMIVDAPSGKGRVLLFANNPIYRWQTFGEHGMVFNALLFYNDFPPVPARTPATTQQ
jgi:hypothetical protein